MTHCLVKRRKYISIVLCHWISIINNFSYLHTDADGPILETIILINWSELQSWIYFYINTCIFVVLNKNLKNVLVGPTFCWSLAGGLLWHREDADSWKRTRCKDKTYGFGGLHFQFWCSTTIWSYRDAQFRLNAWAHWVVSRGSHEHRGFMLIYVAYSMIFNVFKSTDFVGSTCTNTISIYMYMYI